MISLDLSKKIYVVPVSKKSCEFSIYVLFYFIVIWNIKTPQPNRWYYYSLYCTTILLGPFRSRFAKLWRSVLCQNTKVHLIYGSFLWDYSQCSAEVMSFAKLKGMSKSWSFYSTFLVNYGTVCNQQKDELLIGNCMKNQGKYKEAR